jgi:hypothetical protein
MSVYFDTQSNYTIVDVDAKSVVLETSSYCQWYLCQPHVGTSAPAAASIAALYSSYSSCSGARSSIVGWGTMLQARRSRVRFPMR